MTGRTSALGAEETTAHNKKNIYKNKHQNKNKIISTIIHCSEYPDWWLLLKKKINKSYIEYCTPPPGTQCHTSACPSSAANQGVHQPPGQSNKAQSKHLYIKNE